MSQNTGIVLQSYDRQGERAIAFAQASIAFVILLFHIISSLKSDMGFGNPYVIGALSMLICNSAFRVLLAKRNPIPEKHLGVLSIFDVGLFVFLIWSYQHAYELPAGSTLKSTSFFLLFAIVATRSLRFHPVPILTTGIAALAGAVLLVVGSIRVDGSEMIATSYVEYLFSAKILIGAETEKIIGLFSMVACLACGTAWARGLLYQIDSVIEHLPQGVALIDKQKRIAVFNSMFRILYKIDSNEISVGSKIQELRTKLQIMEADEEQDDQSAQGDETSYNPQILSTIQRTQDGQLYSVRQKSMPDGSIVSTTEDVTESQRIEFLAFHDPLTGLANRSKLKAYLSRLELTDNCNGAIFVIDLDNFKPVNDQYGHQVGDFLLIEIAKRLRSIVREDDLIARIGGDEFVIAIETESPTATAKRIAAKIIEVSCSPFEIEGRTIQIGASVGVRVFKDGLAYPDILIDEADKALYQAKEEGKNQFRFAEAA